MILNLRIQVRMFYSFDQVFDEIIRITKSLEFFSVDYQCSCLFCTPVVSRFSIYQTQLSFCFFIYSLSCVGTYTCYCSDYTLL